MNPFVDVRDFGATVYATQDAWVKSWAAGGPVDSLAALQAAHDAAFANAQRIWIGGWIYISAPWEIFRPLVVMGSGGVDVDALTWIVPAPGVESAIILHSWGTSGGRGTANGAKLMDFAIGCAFGRGTVAAKHGVVSYVRAVIEDVCVTNPVGDGVLWHGQDDDPAPSNCNGWNVRGGRFSESSGGSGIRAEGIDANAGLVLGASLVSNAEFGIHDFSELGSGTVMCMTEGNKLGPARSESQVASPAHVGMYVESGQGSDGTIHFEGPGAIFGGLGATLDPKGAGAKYGDTVSAVESINSEGPEQVVTSLGRSGPDMTAYEATFGERGSTAQHEMRWQRDLAQGSVDIIVDAVPAMQLACFDQPLSDRVTQFSRGVRVGTATILSDPAIYFSSPRRAGDTLVLSGASATYDVPVISPAATRLVCIADGNPGTQWKPSHAYVAGASVIDPVRGYQWSCSQAGTSGATTPAWPGSGRGAKVIDGSAEWTCGPLGVLTRAPGQSLVIAQLVASSAGIAGNNAVFRVVRAGITDATTEPLQYLLGIRQTRFSDGGAALVPHAYGYQGAVLALVP